MRVRAARGAIMVDRDERRGRARRHRAAARVRCSSATTSSSDDLISVLFTVTDDLALGVPRRGRAPDGSGRGAADVRARDPRRGLDAVGDPAARAFPLGAVAGRGACTCTSTGRSRCAMTSTAAERVAVVGTGLIGTSVALAAARAGCEVAGLGRRPRPLAARRPQRGSSPRPPAPWRTRSPAPTSSSSRPRSPRSPRSSAAVLAAAPDAVVTDAGSIKERVVREVVGPGRPERARRFVGGHPMGGSSARVPSTPRRRSWTASCGRSRPTTTRSRRGRRAGGVGRVGSAGRPVRLDPERHDRLVAFVSHLPQVASTALMGLAATEEADEPDILLLAAGGFRDLTRLAASNPALWSEILLANREAIAEAIELYIGAARATCATRSLGGRGGRRRARRSTARSRRGCGSRPSPGAGGGRRAAGRGPGPPGRARRAHRRRWRSAT